MQASPAYSVVIPLWNKEREVTRAVASVLSQEPPNLEVIVVNDGSTDAGRAVVARIADPRVKIVDQPNQGVSAARNTGIAHARAAHVAFLDADDEWLPDFLERITDLVLRHPEAAVFATGVLRETGGARCEARVSGVERDLCGIVPSYFRTSGLLTSSSVVVRRSVFGAAGLFAVGVPFGEDLDMWLRLAARFSIAFDSHPSALLHCDASNRASERCLPSCLDTLVRSLEEIRRSPEIADDVKRAAREHVATIGLSDIERRLARGQVSGARALARSWRGLFRPTTRYWLLSLASALPPAALRSAGRTGAWVKTKIRD